METNERPRVVVGVLVYRADGDIFLMRSHKWGDRWVIPGGHIEFGEYMKDAVRREMKEETAMDVIDIEFVDASEGVFPPEFQERRHFVYLHFFARTNNDTVVLNDEAQEYVWVNATKALEMTLVPTVKPLIEKYLERVARAA